MPATCSSSRRRAAADTARRKAEGGRRNEKIVRSVSAKSQGRARLAGPCDASGLPFLLRPSSFLLVLQGLLQLGPDIPAEIADHRARADDPGGKSQQREAGGNDIGRLNLHRAACRRST